MLLVFPTIGVCYAKVMTAKINNKTDEEAWLRYMSGNQQALTELVEKYHSRIVGFLAARKCKDSEATCQDVWTRVISKRDSFDGKSFSGWVFAIARNMFNEQYRRAKTRDESNLSPEYDVVDDEAIIGLARMERQEMIDITQKCMELVGEPFITAFRMKLDGDSAKAIVEKIGATENTVYTRIHRAKKMIQDCGGCPISC